MRTSLYALEAVKSASTPRRQPGAPLSFRPLGDQLNVPGKAYDFTTSAKTVTVATDRGVAIIDPTK